MHHPGGWSIGGVRADREKKKKKKKPKNAVKKMISKPTFPAAQNWGWACFFFFFFFFFFL
jgi:hypothetical protein